MSFEQEIKSVEDRIKYENLKDAAIKIVNQINRWESQRLDFLSFVTDLDKQDELLQLKTTLISKIQASLNIGAP